MWTLGETLRQARLDKSMSLADAARDTRIRRSYLEALEAEDVASLPPPVYTRGFVRTYAEYLGLNPQAMVDLYQPNVHREPTPALRPAVPHLASKKDALAWLEAERANLQAGADYAASHGLAVHAVWLPAQLGDFLRMHGYLDQALALHQAAAGIARFEGMLADVDRADDAHAVFHAAGRAGRRCDAGEEGVLAFGPRNGRPYPEADCKRRSQDRWYMEPN